MIDQDELKKHLRYDPDTGEFWWIRRRAGRQLYKPAGCRMSHGYCKIRVHGRDYLTHRLVWLYVYGEWPPEEVDHIDGDPSNNKLHNLRLASHKQNLRNHGIRSNNTSGFKGVSWHAGAKRWQAQIKGNDRVKYLGLFDCPKEAHAAYCEAARALYGEFFNDGVVR